MSKECKHEEWNPCGNDFYSCRKCGILRTSQQVNLYAEKDRQISDLEAKLAEKEKEVAYMTKQAKKFNNEAQKYFEDAYCNDTIYQDKISFAVEQLINTKGRMQHCILFNSSEDYLNVIQQIDNQIKQLKEGK